MAVDVGSPFGGIIWDSKSSTGWPEVSKPFRNYAQSKVGMLYLAREMALRYGGESASSPTGPGIFSVAWDPGNVVSELTRNVPWFVWRMMKMTYLHPIAMAVHSPLFAGWSEEVMKLNNDGESADMVIGWGRLAPVRSDIKSNLKRKSNGGNGGAQRFWQWCEQVTADFI